MRPAAILLGLALAACRGGAGADDGDDGDDGDDAPTVDARILDDGAPVTRVVVEVDYATGAQPYTGPIIGFGDAWDLTASNLDRIYSGRRDLTVPRTLAQMEAIGAVADPALTGSEILALAGLHRDVTTGGDTVAYYVIFVDSEYDDGTGPRPDVLGVSLGGNGVVAMFKPVIESTANILVPNLEKFVEQAVMVHELGHAVGLVNVGVPLTSPHQDLANGAHCTSQSCVMYFANEGVADMTAYAQQYVLTGNTILFGPECLADVDAFYSP